MTSYNLQRLEQAFSDAVECDSPAEQTQFLGKLAEEDPALAAEVKSLLAIEARADLFFEASHRDRLRMLMTTLGTQKQRLSEADLQELLAQAQPPPANSTGELARLSGQFALTELVAIGSTGFVFQGWDCHLNRKVAIKALAPSIGRQPKFRTAFIDEARLASQVSHPNVVTIYHVSSPSENEPVFCVMQWINGKTLQHWLDHHLDELQQRIMPLLQQLSDGIGAIHKQGIIHRDIKPGNILIDTRAERAVIVDFGIALENNFVQPHLLPAGTPLYMSPEQIQGQSLSFQSDQFSFAEIAFQLLCGHHPFLSPSVSELLEQILASSLKIDLLPPRFMQCGGGEVFRKALAPRAEDRYPSIDDFTRNLLAALEVATNKELARPVDRIPPPTELPVEAAAAMKLGNKPRRHPAFAFAAVAGLAAIALGLIPLSAFALRLIVARSLVDAAGTLDNPASGNNSVTHTASGATPERWIDDETMINSVGIEFKKYPAPVSLLAASQWPPFPKYPELTASLDWRNCVEPFLMSKNLITWRQYLAVVGELPIALQSKPADLDQPIVELNFDEAQGFCKRLNELEQRRPAHYFIPPLDLLAFAEYGQNLLTNPDSVDAHVALLLDENNTSSESIPGPWWQPSAGASEVQYWSWTSQRYRGPKNVEGVVSFRERDSFPQFKEYHLFSGGKRGFFLHWYDTYSAQINDHLVSYENIREHTEPDGQTIYLSPIELGKRASVTYRYRSASPILQATLLPSVYTHNANSECGIDIRIQPAGAVESLESQPWQTVVDAKGEQKIRDPLDLTPFLQGAMEFEVRYWVSTTELPLHYAQVARTITFSYTNLTGYVHWVSEKKGLPDWFSAVAPESFRDPRVGFRVGVTLGQQE